MVEWPRFWLTTVCLGLGSLGYAPIASFVFEISIGEQFERFYFAMAGALIASLPLPKSLRTHEGGK